MATSGTAFAGLAIGAVALLALGMSGLVAAAALLAILFFGFRTLCMRQIGGQTGDTLGALQQAGEMTVLIVAASVLT